MGKKLLWAAGTAAYAGSFTVLSEYSWRTAFLRSYLEEHASPAQILSADWPFLAACLAAALVLSGMVYLLAVRVRAWWTVRIGKRSYCVSALALMLAVNVLALVYLGISAYVENARYLADRGQVKLARSMLAGERKILHAGGSITGPDGSVYRYTNSREAFLQTLESGAHFIELDFLYTTDGELVCMHNWSNENLVLEDGTRTDKAVSLEAFRKGRIEGLFTPMTAEDAMEILADYPDASIVIDLKAKDMLGGYRELAERYSDLMGQLIPQFYHASQYDDLYGFGYRKLIFSLYRSGRWEYSPAALDSIIRRKLLTGVTFRDEYVDGGDLDDLFRRVLSSRQPVCVHTVDDPARQKEMFEKGVTAVYTNGETGEK